VNGQSLYYTHANAGKRGVGVDLRTEAGAELVARLADEADVFIENFRPGVLARRGLGPDDLRARNPRLVYCSISGWGQDGPWANRQAYAPLIHAEAGRIELAARLRDEPPRQELHNHGDINAAMCATHAVLAGLFQRERTGLGQHLDVSLAEALVYTDEWSSTDVYGYGRERFFDIWTHPVFTLADGTDVAMVGNPVRVWDQWLAALDDEPRPCPDDHDDALAVLRALVTRVPDFPTLEAMLEPYPMLVAEVRSVAELAATPWAESRGLFVEVEPDTRVVAAPFRSRAADVGVRGPAPRAGEHTRAVLTEVLGLDGAQLDALEADGAIY
jgi:crotonobetainyl-CoA:carnitine CoA-transferase CaiB-like acyl-CoA transferase